MSLTIFIIIGIILSIIISAINRLVGAVVSLFLTTGVFFYGIDLYRTEGWKMHFLNIEISKDVFLILIAVWYLFDIIELIIALRKRK